MSKRIEWISEIDYEPILIDDSDYVGLGPEDFVILGVIEMNNEMIPLTIANTLDQSMKTRVEVPDTTVKQTVKHANLAPKGNYDAYDSTGVIISNNNTQLSRFHCVCGSS